MILPQQLISPGFKFVICESKSKKPIDAGWTKKGISAYKINEIFQTPKTVNLGVLGGFGNLVIVDADHQKTVQLIRDYLPASFATASGSQRGFGHFYFVVDDLPPNAGKVVLDDGDEHLGEIISFGSFVVCPPSVHPSGSKYHVVQDLPIPHIKSGDLVGVFRPYASVAKKQDTPRMGVSRQFNKNILDVLDISDFRKTGSDYRGPHPVHGSATGANFSVTADGEKWYCFRHGVGGGILEYISMIEGLVRCEEVNK